MKFASPKDVSDDKARASWMACAGSRSMSACSLAASRLNASSPAWFPFLLIAGRIAKSMPQSLLDLILGIMKFPFMLIRVDHVLKDR
jgi:hypothetical protein